MVIFVKIALTEKYEISRGQQSFRKNRLKLDEMYTIKQKKEYKQDQTKLNKKLTEDITLIVYKEI